MFHVHARSRTEPMHSSNDNQIQPRRDTHPISRAEVDGLCKVVALVEPSVVGAREGDDELSGVLVRPEDLQRTKRTSQRQKGYSANLAKPATTLARKHEEASLFEQLVEYCCVLDTIYGCQ